MAENKRCYKCGNECEENDKFCVNCGADMTSYEKYCVSFKSTESDDDKAGIKEVKNYKNLIIGTGVFLFVVSIIGISAVVKGVQKNIPNMVDSEIESSVTYDSTTEVKQNSETEITESEKLNPVSETVTTVTTEIPVTTAVPVKSIAEEYVECVIENDCIWLDAMNNSGYGFNECWFQDIDMDGTPEFIVGGQLEGNSMGVFFKIYTYQNGELITVPYERDNSDVGFWGTGSDGGSEGFVCQLYKNANTGSFTYVYESSDGTASETYNFLEEIQKTSNTVTGKEIITLFTDYTYGKEYSYYSDDKNISYSQFTDIFYDYFANLIPYSTTIKSIPCTQLADGMTGQYDIMTYDDKKTALLESYNSWNYSESSHDNIEAPFSDVILNLKSENDVNEENNSQNSISNIGVVVTNEGTGLNMRSTPDVNIDNKIMLIPDNARVEIYSQSGEWCFINYNGTTGYVASSYVARELKTLSSSSAGYYMMKSVNEALSGLESSCEKFPSGGPLGLLRSDDYTYRIVSGKNDGVITIIGVMEGGQAFDGIYAGMTYSEIADKFKIEDVYPAYDDYSGGYCNRISVYINNRECMVYFYFESGRSDAVCDFIAIKQLS